MSRLGPHAPALALLVVTGCAGAPTIEQQLAAWRVEASAIDRRSDPLPALDGTFERGDTAGTWRAWFEDDQILLIQERLALGNYGERQAGYYFENGTLRYYVDTGRGLDLGSGSSQEIRDIRREIAFDDDGREVASRKTVDGVLAPVEPAAVVGVRRHAREIEREAARLRPS